MLAEAHVATRLPAKDLERARKVYSEKLGLAPVEMRPGGLLYRCGSGSFALFESAGDASGTHTQMGWEVADIEATLVFAETGVITREIAVAEIRKENAQERRWEHVEFNDIRCLRMADDVALVTYHVSARWAGEASSSSALASSVYVRRIGEWKLAFHQQTPTNANKVP